MTDTRKDTKDDMQRQAKRVKAANILKNMRCQNIQDTLNEMISKYGVDMAYKLIQCAALKPTEISGKMNKTMNTSRAVVDYMQKNKLTDRQVADITQANINDVQASRKNKVTTVHSNSNANSSQQRMNNRLNKRGNQKRKKSSLVQSLEKKDKEREDFFNKNRANTKKVVATKTKKSATKPVVQSRQPVAAEDNANVPASIRKPKTSYEKIMDERDNLRDDLAKQRTGFADLAEEKMKKLKQKKENSPSLSPVQKTAQKPDYSAFKFKADENSVAEWLNVPEKSKEQQAKEEYQKAMESRFAGNLSIQELMATGVTQTDIQAVINENPESVCKLEAGATNRKLSGKARHKVSAEKAGNCLSGVQDIVGDKGFWANGTWWNDIPKVKGEDDNSACNAHKALANSGMFVPVTIRNKAFRNPSKNEEMNKLVDKCAVGTIVNTDNIPDEISRYANSSVRHGHVFVIENSNGSKMCDIRQSEIDYSRYGKNIHISLAKDMGVPEDFAEKCIVAKLEREQREKEIAARVAEITR